LGEKHLSVSDPSFKIFFGRTRRNFVFYVFYFCAQHFQCGVSASPAATH